MAPNPETVQLMQEWYHNIPPDEQPAANAMCRLFAAKIVDDTDRALMICRAMVIAWPDYPILEIINVIKGEATPPKP